MVTGYRSRQLEAYLDYLDLEFVSQYTDMTYTAFEDPARVVVRTKWNDLQLVTAQKNSEIRQKGGIKSSIVAKVKKGDTLYSIAQKYHCRVRTLLDLNPFVDIYNLQPGEEICVPDCRGQGKVDFRAVFTKLHELGYNSYVTIEREIDGPQQLTDILERVPEDETPLVVLFDGVTDVRNFGAIARSAECAGAHGLITPLKNSAPVNAEAIRSSAGALTTIPVCRVGSVRNTLKALQAEGFQVVAATEKSRKLLYDADFRRPTVIVMGAEDTGISKEVLKLCDEQLAIPLIGHIESLNVSAAAAVMLFEVVRQRIGPEN